MTAKSAGIFISFEGIDGAGKSTHLPAVVEALRAGGHTVSVTREPGGTVLAEKLRTLILNDNMDALTESLLVFAARRDHVETLIRPALARGEVVVCDRFTDASFAYQGTGRGFDNSILTQLEQWVQSQAGRVLQPDLTVWFDLHPQIAAQRLAGTRVPDKFESQPVAFFEAVRRGYADRANADPKRFARIEADQSPAEVLQAVMLAVGLRGYLV